MARPRMHPFRGRPAPHPSQLRPLPRRSRYTREPGDDNGDERDQRWIDFYDGEALDLMQGWWGSSGDPLYAIASSGGNYAWVFEDAISNLDRDIGRVKKLGRNKFQLGGGTFTAKEIDELRIIRDALAQALRGAGRRTEAREARPLISSQDTPKAERLIRSAAAAKFGRGRADLFFEHGQWWATVGSRSYSVVDAIPGVDHLGIDFEPLG